MTAVIDQNFHLEDNKPPRATSIDDIVAKGETATEEERTIAKAYFETQVGNARARNLNPFASKRKTARHLREIADEAEAAGYPDVAAECDVTLNAMGRPRDGAPALSLNPLRIISKIV